MIARTVLNQSLPTQWRAYEEDCRGQGSETLERFHEEGESANTTDRNQLQNLLKHCRTRKGKVHFVIVYNRTRFAREKYDHFALRAHLKSLGTSPRSRLNPYLAPSESADEKMVNRVGIEPVLR